MQRDRIVSATADVIAKEGYRAATLEQIVKEAKVAWTTFYEAFDDKEQAFLAAFDETVEGVRAVLADTVDGDTAWADRVTIAVTTILELAAKYPERASVVFVEASAVSDESKARLAALTAELGSELHKGPPLPGVSKEAAKFETPLVGGMFFTIKNRIAEGQAKKLDELIPGLLQNALSSHLSQDEARKRAAAVAKRRGK